jgi:pimeloyl-ACP methyl ester carboxylesterase
MTLNRRSMGRRMWRDRWRALVLVLVLLGGSGCSTVAKSSEQQVFAKPRYGADRFVAVRGYKIHYVEAGEGTPILLVPGAFTTYRAWNRVLRELASRHRVLAVDYLGVGDSDKPEQGFGYTVEEQADVLAEMIVILQLSGVSVVGASYGGALALNLAARYPDLVDKVVSIEGGALITPEALNYGSLGDLIEWPVLGDIIWGFMKSGLFDRTTARSVMGEAWSDLTPEEQREIIDIFSANIMTVSRVSWTKIYRVITRRIDFIASLADTRVPLLYLYGEKSKYRAVAEMNASRLEAQNPGAEIVPFMEGIHDLHLQYPHAVASTILRFLAANPGARIVAGRRVVSGSGGDSAPDGTILSHR